MTALTPCETKIGCKGPIATTRKEGRCNYHTCGKMPVASLAPSGMCPAAYHALLPDALGVLYSGATSVSVACPAPDNPVRFEIRASKLSWRFRLLNLVKKFVHRYIFPLALFRRGVVIQVYSKGFCPFGMQYGERFALNLGNLQITNDFILPFGSPREVCPAGAVSLYPFLAHTREDTPVSVLCPDHLANVDYTIEP